MNRTNTKPLICNKENHVIWKLLQNAPGDQIFFPLSYQPRISFKLLLLIPTKYQQNAEYLDSNTIPYRCILFKELNKQNAICFEILLQVLKAELRLLHCAQQSSDCIWFKIC